jgi:GH15 family glucan-1,4-alpha-glucosidase
MVLAASEDKTYRGGFVAAPGRPWAWANVLQFLAVYHAVWSRDLYEIATALIAMGDRAAANRALDYLFNVQQRPDGSAISSPVARVGDRRGSTARLRNVCQLARDPTWLAVGCRPQVRARRDR